MYAVFSVEKNNIGKADEILKDDVVSRQSIAVRDASALDIDSENRYILIEGNEQAIKRAEELFKGIVEVLKKSLEAVEEKAEEEPKKEIGEKLSEKEASEIYDKIKKEEENVAEGVGFIFGE
ncbi:MAG: hypothetical protein QMC80_09315 [Thermoplasmatales archaeon]|nr:hypothetical protein [Thermoplasmatales archaeon]